MPPERLPRHIKDALLHALHGPSERVARYTIVWSEGEVHMDVAYLTDEQQQQRLRANSPTCANASKTASSSTA